MNLRRLGLLLGGSALAGLGLGLALLPKLPVRELSPVVAAPASRQPARTPEARQDARRVARYSARATPLWILAGVTLTASGRHEDAAQTEAALQGLAQARTSAAPDLHGLLAAHSGILAAVRSSGNTGDVAPLLVRLDQATQILAGAEAAPPAGRGAQPAASELEGRLEAAPAGGLAP